MTLEEVAVIETILRQSWYSDNDPEQRRFGSWLEVDPDQALDLLELIPNRLPVHPQPFTFAGQPAPHPDPQPEREGAPDAE